MSEKLTVEQFKEVLPEICSKDTSADPDGWTQENPTWGHCAVATLVAQNLFGGKILRGSLENTPFAKMRSHYWNSPTEEQHLDFTAPQFKLDKDDKIFFSHLYHHAEPRTREYLMSNAETKRRYYLLMYRLAKKLSDNNPIFEDKTFQRCYELAFSEKANCPKMRFATVVYDGDRKIAEEVNRHMGEQFGKPRFCSFDGSECVRLGVQSRMDALMGDCGHSPQWALRKVFDLGYKPSDLPNLDFYEAGFQADGTPWWRADSSYTCLYCQNAFAVFGLDKIWGTVQGHSGWQKLWTKDSFYSAPEYATGKKKA